MVSLIISTVVQCLIGWILIEKVPSWLGIRGVFATVLKVIGVLIIIFALLAWI